MEDHPKTGPTLLSDIENLQVIRIPIIENLLLEKNVLMISAEPGAGKSILSTQAMLSLSSGKPLFGEFQIPTPKKVVYLQLEGDYVEFIERMRGMREVTGINADNIHWVERLFMDCSSESSRNTLFKEIEFVWIPEVIIIDPIYLLTPHDIASERGSKSIITFLKLVRQRFNCTIWLNHHTHRPKYENGKQLREDDPFFGSQWLKAHVDISYHMKATENHRGVALFCQKDRSKSVSKEIILHYDPETYTCYTETKPESMSGEERVINYLRLIKSMNKTTDFYEVSEKCQVSHAHLRRIQMRQLKIGNLRCDKVLNKKKIWESLVI